MIRITTAIISALFLITLPASAIDFLGVELCRGSTDTGVKLPIGSSLILEDVEIGEHGGLVILVKARSGKVMNHVDDLMTGLTGQRGEGDEDTLQWADGRLTGVAQKMIKKYVALAVTSTDDCPGTEPAPAPVPTAAAAESTAATAPVPPTESTVSTPPPDPVPMPAAAAAVVAAAKSNSSPPPASVPATIVETDFELVGAMTHSAADEIWVDVMGTIVNHTDTSYKTATFDLSMYSDDGLLICVDTISVSIFKPGQERAFRDSIRCVGYEAAEIAEVRLQFAGGF